MYEMQDFLTAFLNQMSNFASAILTLVIFHKLMSPRVEFSKFIKSEEVPDKGRSRYSIKLAKRGPIDLVGVSITCRLYVQDIFSVGSGSWTTYNIPTTYSESTVLGRDNRVVYLSLHKSIIVTGANGAQIKKKILEKYSTSDVKFEYILSLFRRSYVQVDLMGNDRFTGVLKIYSSKHYENWTIREGKWRSESCELIQASA